MEVYRHMAHERIQGKLLTERFRQYVEFRKKETEQKGKSFTEQMKDVTSSQKEPAESSLRQVAVQSTPHHVRPTPPRFGKPKPITELQARRLARYAPYIQNASAKHNVPVELICGVILQESGGNPKAKSHAGAKGLMQLMPQTAKRFGVTESYDPAQNIDGGTRYLRTLLDRFHGDIELTLAAYNAGENAVEKHGNRIPPYRETRNYVPAVLGYTQSMVDILIAQMEPSSPLPTHARRA